MGALPGGCDLIFTMTQYVGWLIRLEYNSEKYSKVVILPWISSKRTHVYKRMILSPMMFLADRFYSLFVLFYPETFLLGTLRRLRFYRKFQQDIQLWKSTNQEKFT